MNKQKRNELYSFKALSQPKSSQKALEDSIQSIQLQQDDEFFINKNYQSQYQNKIKSGIYRHEKIFQKSKFQPQLKVYGDLDQYNNRTHKVSTNHYQPRKDYQNIQMHPKILSLDQQIEQNVKRRLVLEQQMNRLKKLQSQNKLIENQSATIEKSNQPYIVQKQFALRNLQTNFIDRMVARGDQRPFIKKPRQLVLSGNKLQQAICKKQKNQKINKNIQILNDDHLQTILSNGFNNNSNHQNLSKGFYDLNSFMEIDAKQPMFQNNKKIKKAIKQIQTSTPPPITAIQNMIFRLTFPQVPKENVQKLLQKCLQLNAIHQSHSDIIYLLMVGSFHTGNFHDVRRYFKEILTFKKFQTKAYWVAAQTEYGLENFERCIKLTDYCMQNLDSKYLPRFLYLKAKCYNQQGNFTNSIVCYNQLIRIRPKIAQYYLQRAILYDKLGYQRECKQDYLMFGILKPDAKNYLQEKIIVESNDAKRKQLLQIYKRLV